MSVAAATAGYFEARVVEGVVPPPLQLPEVACRAERFGW
jgi:hypothetical protein